MTTTSGAQVTLKSRDMQEKYVVSCVLLKNLENNLTREVRHMWFTGWPATGVPNTERPFISFILAVRTAAKQHKTKAPIIVHCRLVGIRTAYYRVLQVS